MFTVTKAAEYMYLLSSNLAALIQYNNKLIRHSFPPQLHYIYKTYIIEFITAFLEKLYCSILSAKNKCQSDKLNNTNLLKNCNIKINFFLFIPLEKML